MSVTLRDIQGKPERFNIESSPESNKSYASSDTQIYCFCRRPDDHELMIQCNKCDEWFHGACVNISSVALINIDEYICPICCGTRPSVEGLRSHYDPDFNVSSQVDYAPVGYIKMESKSQNCLSCGTSIKQGSKFCSEDCIIRNAETLIIQLLKEIPKKKVLKRKKEDEPYKRRTSTQDNTRENVRKGFLDIFNKFYPADVSFNDSLSEEIESVLYETLQEEGLAGTKYKAKYRSLFFNLKDERNERLRERIYAGQLKPEELVRLTAEELANEDLESKIKILREKSIINSIVTPEEAYNFVKKTHKGSEPLLPTKMDTLASSFDLFSPNSEVSDLFSPIELKIPETIHEDNKEDHDTDTKPTFHTDEIEIEIDNDREDNATATSNTITPIIKATSTAQPETHLQTSWTGKINLTGVSKLQAQGKQIGGRIWQHASRWKIILPSTLSIQGRIEATQAYTYLSKILEHSSTKDISILLLTPANGEHDLKGYTVLCEHFASRERVAVVPPTTDQTKDIYLIPVSRNDEGWKVPDCLPMLVEVSEAFEQVGLDSVLLCIAVHNKNIRTRKRNA